MLISKKKSAYVINGKRYVTSGQDGVISGRNYVINGNFYELLLIYTSVSKLGSTLTLNNFYISYSTINF